MKTFYRIEDFAPAAPGKTALTLGCFDGIHLGHREIISRLLETRSQQGGSAGLVTFDPAPAVALGASPDRSLIATLDEKLQILKSLGLDWTLVIPCDPAFMLIEAEDFLRDILLGTIRADTIIIGHDAAFGRGRRGDEHFLRAQSPAAGFNLIVQEAVQIGGQTVSSTQIRKLIHNADLQAAALMLGRPFTFSGVIIQDKQLGRTIGVPTANLDIHPHKIIVPDGIYAARATLGSSALPAVMSIGVRPTVANDGRRAVEVHILDFDQDIYGQTLAVEPVARLREEKKFSSLEELKNQINLDISAARAALK